MNTTYICKNSFHLLIPSIPNINVDYFIITQIAYHFNYSSYFVLSLDSRPKKVSLSHQTRKYTLNAKAIIPKMNPANIFQVCFILEMSRAMISRNEKPCLLNPIYTLLHSLLLYLCCFLASSCDEHNDFR